MSIRATLSTTKHRLGIPTNCRDFLLLWLKAQHRFFRKPCIERSTLPIDVVIPVIEKDADIFPFVTEAVRKYIMHPIHQIIAIAPESAILQRLCQDHGCKYVHEDSVLPISRNDVKWDYHGLDRSGWVFQQFLKWSGNVLSTQDHYLCVDADTVFACPQSFERGGKMVFNCSDEYHWPYMHIYEKLLGEPVQCRVSFTSHQMLFQVSKLEALKALIEARHGCVWYNAILQNLDPDVKSGHSDYETYGQYVYAHYREQMVLEYWANMDYLRSNFNQVDELLKASSGRHKSLSFHHWRV